MASAPIIIYEYSGAHRHHVGGWDVDLGQGI